MTKRERGETGPGGMREEAWKVCGKAKESCHNPEPRGPGLRDVQSGIWWVEGRAGPDRAHQSMGKLSVQGRLWLTQLLGVHPAHASTCALPAVQVATRVRKNSRAELARI